MVFYLLKRYRYTHTVFFVICSPSLHPSFPPPPELNSLQFQGPEEKGDWLVESFQTAPPKVPARKESLVFRLFLPSIDPSGRCKIGHELGMSTSETTVGGGGMDEI